MITHISQKGFIPAPIFTDEYIFGGNSKLQEQVLREDGDWSDYIPQFEDQYKNGVESMSCVSYGTLNAIEVLQEEKFGEHDVDYSERFISTLGGTTKQGNNPQKIAETVRKYGLIPEERLPFSGLETWEEYFADIPKNLKQEGKRWLWDWKFGHDWVITNNTRREEKNELLKDALKFSPIGVSVFGWAEINGVYVKHGSDNHWCLLLNGDRDYWYVLDTYPSYIKKLEKSYDFGYAKRYTLNRAEVGNWVFDLFRRFFVV